MGAIEKVSRLLTVPAVETAYYRCRNCGADVGSSDTACPDCGGEPREVSEPVQYVYHEMY